MPHRSPQDQQSASEWARTMLDDPKAIILDFETTDVKDAEIVQIGAINMQGDVLMETLVKPATPISPGAQRVHGISAETVRSAPDFAKLYIQFSALLGGATVIAYNVKFEQSVVNSVCTRRKLPMPRPKTWTCAMQTYAKFYGMWNPRRNFYTWQSLSKACAQQQIIVRDAHDALGDCRLTLALIQKMAG